MIDLSKLPPAPWTRSWDEWNGDVILDCPEENCCGKATTVIAATHDRDFHEEITAAPIVLDFAVLARNAFDVMVRRGWTPAKSVGHRWILIEPELSPHVQSGRLLTAADDPFTCLVEADRWYRENVESKQGVSP